MFVGIFLPFAQSLDQGKQFFVSGFFFRMQGPVLFGEILASLPLLLDIENIFDVPVFRNEAFMGIGMSRSIIFLLVI